MTKSQHLSRAHYQVGHWAFVMPDNESTHGSDNVGPLHVLGRSIKPCRAQIHHQNHSYTNQASLTQGIDWDSRRFPTFPIGVAEMALWLRIRLMNRICLCLTWLVEVTPFEEVYRSRTGEVSQSLFPDLRGPYRALPTTSWPGVAGLTPTAHQSETE